MAVSPYGQALKAPATLAETVVYTSSGTFEKANYPGLKYVRVRCIGGGGGGGGGPATTSSQASFGAGGSGAATAISLLSADDLGASETVTVGAAGGGGASGASGSDGGTSSFGAHVSAPGGNGGAASLVDPPFAHQGTNPPTTGTGDVIIPGGIGGSGGAFSSGQVYGGEGGNSTQGSGGSQQSNPRHGTGGTGYGSGGSGAAVDDSRSAFNGGSGTGGIVLVDVYVLEQGLVGDTGFVHVNQFPKGELGYVEGSATSGVTSETDLTGMSISVYVPAGRVIKVTVHERIVDDTAGDLVLMRLYEDASAVGQDRFTIGSSSSHGEDHWLIARLRPSEGFHTYKATLDRLSGTGTLSTTANSANPHFILVEDLGPA